MSPARIAAMQGFYTPQFSHVSDAHTAGRASYVMRFRSVASYGLRSAMRASPAAHGNLWRISIWASMASSPRTT